MFVDFYWTMSYSFSHLKKHRTKHKTWDCLQTSVITKLTQSHDQLEGAVRGILGIVESVPLLDRAWLRSRKEGAVGEIVILTKQLTPLRKRPSWIQIWRRLPASTIFPWCMNKQVLLVKTIKCAPYVTINSSSCSRSIITVRSVAFQSAMNAPSTSSSYLNKTIRSSAHVIAAIARCKTRLWSISTTAYSTPKPARSPH